MGGVHSGRERESARKKQGAQKLMRGFCCSGLIFLGSGLITQLTGVTAAQTQHSTLLMHASDPLRALAVGPKLAAVHFGTVS
jgi:hypothetical protein